MLALVQGRYPAGAGQVAVTSGLAQNLQVHIGSVLSLPGHHQRVTGIVENPSDLKDQFALVSPSAAGPAQGVTVLLDASPAGRGQPGGRFVQEVHLGPGEQAGGQVEAAAHPPE
jgi:putative ABC transport system permease protein